MLKIDNGDVSTDFEAVFSLSGFASVNDDVEAFVDLDTLGIFGTNRMTSIILMKDPNAAIVAADVSLKIDDYYIIRINEAYFS